MAHASKYVFTPYADLVEGDEFVRIVGRPVLLRDLLGHREGSQYYPDFLGPGSRQYYPIFRMERTPGGYLTSVAQDERHKFGWLACEQQETE